MIARTLTPKLREAAAHYPVVTLTGPRQSGKTTLVRAIFKKHRYLSLELPDERRFALEDPRGFLARFEGPVILDEVQRAPDLFSYIQASVDEDPRPGRFILTGSHNFLLMSSVSQSLAGRCAVLHLLPLSLAELTGRPPLKIGSLGREAVRFSPAPPQTLEGLLFSGFFPRIHDQQLPPHDWLSNYYQTYLERDVRNVLQVGDLETFARFIRLCAARNGQLLNLSGLASDSGVTHPTAKRWISILEASFLITLLRPHHKNFGKRLIKAPKLHFLDTGLLCFLLQIRSPEELKTHALRGPLFESFVVAELFKTFLHAGTPATPLHFWRDSAGHEIDVLLDMGEHCVPIEVKSSLTIAGDFLGGIKYWRSLSGQGTGPAALIYAGNDSYQREGTVIYPWFAF